ARAGLALGRASDVRAGGAKPARNRCTAQRAAAARRHRRRGAHAAELARRAEISRAQPEMIRCCLIGRGIAASPSPALHQALMRACGVDGVYELCDVEEAELPALLARVRAGAYRGCNVTIPYKTTVAEAW